VQPKDTNHQQKSEDQELYMEKKPVTEQEVNQVFGIVLYMGVHKLPNRQMYWSNKTLVPLIVNNMTHNRFEEILSTLHFNNNAMACTDPADAKYAKLFKLKPLIDHLRKVFKGSLCPEIMQSIDEMMIPLKRRHGAKQYMPKKPTKWGYKLWCRAGISGYIYDFEVIGSPDAKGQPPAVTLPCEFGESENVVLRLTKDLEEMKHLFFLIIISLVQSSYLFSNQENYLQLLRLELTVVVDAKSQQRKK
jgi:hypothetical protein